MMGYQELYVRKIDASWENCVENGGAADAGQFVCVLKRQQQTPVNLCVCWKGSSAAVGH